jgi:hypothetical protein
VQEIAIVEESRGLGDRPVGLGRREAVDEQVSGVIPTPNAPPGDESRMASVIRSTEEPTAGCSGG